MIGISVAALALRLLHLRAVRSLVIDAPPPPGMDRWLNMEIAAAIARGEWLGGWAVPYDSSPGYSYLLAALYRLSGEHWIGAAAVQLALGAATPILLAAVVRRVRDERAAVLAALLAALYVPAIFYEALLVKFSVVPFVTSVLLYAQIVDDKRHIVVDDFQARASQRGAVQSENRGTNSAVNNGTNYSFLPIGDDIPWAELGGKWSGPGRAAIARSPAHGFHSYRRCAPHGPDGRARPSRR